VLSGIDPGRPSRSVVRTGHYASVLALDDRIGLALATDGVGTKIIVAEALGRYDTVGIDCVAMNANDLVCVGAEPIALLDYIAVEEADPERQTRIAEGLRPLLRRAVGPSLGRSEAARGASPRRGVVGSASI
jgi:phosphoribosylformylglycinamidine cyclo-ligase